MAEEMDEMREIINDFVTETDELILILDNDLIAMENSPDDLELLNKIFRSVHTVKGAAGFLGFDKMVTVVHNLENVLNKCRQGEMHVTSRINDVILRAVDTIKILLDNIRDNEEMTLNIAPLVQQIQECLEEEHLAPPEPEPEPEPEAEVSAVKEDVEVSIEGSLIVEKRRITEDQLAEIIGEAGAKPAQQPAAKPAPKPAPPRKKQEPVISDETDRLIRKGHVLEQTIRVDIDRLDDVMNLVGELVLGRNRIMQIGSELEQSYESDPRMQNLMDTVSQINMVTTDLQLAVMKTRMQPIKKIFNRFPRMVRDLAKGLGKEINLEIIGEETELDKSVIEEIGDPLVHLVRNSVDHGVEEADRRERTGKPREGKVVLAAYYEGNNIIIEVRDDGKGMDPDKILEKGIAKGLVTQAEAERMNEKDKLNLIFFPGFSTAEKTTDISGRGVGMDVVKTNVVKLNGTINIQTEPGNGTTFSIRLPLTVAIIQTLMVGVGEETFALPLASVVETVRTSVENIQYVDQQEVIHLREDVLPLVRLGDVFDVEPSFHVAGEDGKEWMYVVVIAIAEKKMGIIVEKLLGQEEVVIKPLGKYVQAKGIAGATILGNGKVTLIVDLGGLMELIDKSTNMPRGVAAKQQKKKTVEKTGRKTVLIVDDSPVARTTQRKALESAGFRVLEAKHGREGLEKLTENPDISLVVTDIMMPEMNGYEMVANIRKNERLKSLPLIALTVLEDKSDRADVLRSGVDEYFHKSDLNAMVRSVQKLTR